jgi:hypothetical protein
MLGSGHELLLPVSHRLKRGATYTILYSIQYSAVIQDIKHYYKIGLAGLWWLMPLILATQEAEIRRTEVPSQPQQIVCESPS